MRELRAASATVWTAVNGGARTISTSAMSLTAIANSRVNANASCTVLNIFQLAAMNGIRISVDPCTTSDSRLAERDDTRQLAAAEEFQRCAAAGRDVRDAIGDARLGDRGDRVAAADARRAFHDRDRASDLDGPLRECVDLEHAHGAIPRDGLRARDDAAVGRNRRRPDVEPHAIADRGVADVERFSWRARLELRRDDMIHGQLETQVAAFRLLLDLARGIEQVRLDERFPHREPARLEEGVGHRAADEERVHARHEILN